MKASELRLGNLILFRGNLTCLDSNYELFKSLVDISRDDKRYKPIPLTEEWLLKFGFFKYPNIWDTFREEIYDEFQLKITAHTVILFSIPHINKSFIRCSYDKIYRFKENKSDYKIEYVHQLQNLYFALIGEELQIKIPTKKYLTDDPQNYYFINHQEHIIEMMRGHVEETLYNDNRMYFRTYEEAHDYLLAKQQKQQNQ
jgi:hypothetical protein